MHQFLTAMGQSLQTGSLTQSARGSLRRPCFDRPAYLPAIQGGRGDYDPGSDVQKCQLRPGVYNVDRYRMTASDGELVAELDYNGITRGATLDGPDVAVADEPAQPELGKATEEPL